MTRLPVPVFATATNRYNSGDQQMEVHRLSAALNLAVQFVPSGEVMTRLPVPLKDTATNKFN
ncbi:hypothetical protein LPTSP1_15200 [Leptospira johnsonii]|uniref:Uncharacterized protein n=1 Tax=Leptospira johnsonii TaxID=1917820 RepID=A0A2P2D1K0_9LEPT|nr:hypothetical protein LPTSP1_15200 [Leptospira johnsonii]